MSYYDGPQWNAPGQNNWEHQGPSPAAPARAGASAPQPQDDFAFFYQFDEVDRAYENLQKSGKGYGMGGRRKLIREPRAADGRIQHGGPRSHSMNNFDDPRGPPGPNLHNFYASQRHQPSRGSSEAEQVMQAKRRMAAQRERELRNLHTEQQYQRNVLSEMPLPTNKHMSEEETRELIARQRSALYGEGPFADKSGYVDENGNIRPGAPAPNPTPSLRGHSPLAFDNMGRGGSAGDVMTPVSAADANVAIGMMDPTQRPVSTSSPQTAGPTNKVFDNAVGAQSRTSNSSPTNASPPRDLAPGSKPGQANSTVAPIGTRPSGTPTGSSSSKRATTPMNTSGGGGWGRGNGVWGQSSGLGAQASVWG